jgi:two-component system sporulation sensor kinase C
MVLNAVDASPVGGRVTVETRALPPGIAVSVSDEGEGIAEGDRPRLFEPFFSTRLRGAGLSLMACRAVAEAHGGSVDVDARPGRGSRFTLILPASPAGAREEGDVTGA